MPHGVKPRKFLCCLPVRLGVFIMSLGQALFNGLLAALLWSLTGRPEEIRLTKREKAAASIAAIYCSLFALIALFGFCGAIARRHRLVKIYCTVLSWMLGISLFVGVLNMIVIFTVPKKKFIDFCIDSSTDQKVINACNRVNTMRFVIVACFVVIWVLCLYGVIVVRRYANQLNEETSAYQNIRGNASAEYIVFETTSSPGRDYKGAKV